MSVRHVPKRCSDCHTALAADRIVDPEEPLCPRCEIQPLAAPIDVDSELAQANGRTPFVDPRMAKPYRDESRPFGAGDGEVPSSAVVSALAMSDAPRSWHPHLTRREAAVTVLCLLWLAGVTVFFDHLESLLGLRP